MSHQCGITPVVMSGKPVYGESTVACTYCADMVCVDVGLSFDIIGCRIVVLHVLAAVVT